MPFLVGEERHVLLLGRVEGDKEEGERVEGGDGEERNENDKHESVVLGECLRKRVGRTRVCVTV